MYLMPGFLQLPLIMQARCKMAAPFIHGPPCPFSFFPNPPQATVKFAHHFVVEHFPQNANPIGGRNRLPLPERLC